MLDPAFVEWRDEATLMVDGVAFISRASDRFPSEPDRFCVVKRPDLVRRYVELLTDLRPGRIVELGIYQGGSTALLAMLTQPLSMVAVELTPDRVAALDRLLEARQLSDKVQLAYGTSQDDAAAIMAALEDAGVSAPVLDLVVDDASHLVAQTRASFEILFPYVRPGGKYVIEDWSWAHIGYGLHKPDEQPLTELVFELTMVLPSSPGVIAEIHLDRDWAVITRGDADLDPGSFSISRLYNERGRQLLASAIRT
jgi:hypothetical protein